MKVSFVLISLETRSAVVDDAPMPFIGAGNGIGEAAIAGFSMATSKLPYFAGRRLVCGAGVL